MAVNTDSISVSYLGYIIIKGKYHCENCPHNTREFGNITDHVRLDDCETKKHKDFERGKSQRLLNHIKCYPGKHSISHIKKLFGMEKNQSTNNSISYLITTGQIEKCNDKLYPVVEGSN